MISTKLTCTCPAKSLL